MKSLAFIVNTFNDPDNLLVCLGSLHNQLCQGLYQQSIHVADNSSDKDLSRLIKGVCEQFNAYWYKGPGDSCYAPIEMIAKHLKVDYLCFPSSDCYYVPGFASIMLECAERYDADVVYCDVLYDPRLHGRGIYSVLNTFPEMRFIDKGCFLVRHNVFHGFPKHDLDWRDGALIEQLMKEKRVFAKAKGVLTVHN